VPAARDESEMLTQAQKLLELGADAVLIKGGHGGGPDSVDLLVETAGSTRFSAPRVRTENSHGTGCTLASAIAAGLARAFCSAKPWATPRPTSLGLSSRRTGSISVQAVVRCIIFSSGGRRDYAAGAPGCLSGWARAKASIFDSSSMIRVKFGTAQCRH